MRKIQIAIYYNEKEGYIFCPFGILRNGPRIIMGPGTKKETVISADEISNTVKECLKLSENSVPIEKKDMDPNLVLKLAGVDNPKKLNRIYKYLACEKKENYLYVSDKANGRIECIPCEKEDEIGALILRMLVGVKVMNIGNNLTFTTINKNIISYSIPSDDFDDIGDGHTDAYQIFSYRKGENSYIAFLIDNGYKDFSETSIKNRWQVLYGDIHDFQYKELDESILKIKVSAKTNTKELNSCFFIDGDGLLEVMAEINILALTENNQKKAIQEYWKLIESVKVTST